MYFTRDDSALVLIDHQVETMQVIRSLDAGQVKRFTIDLATMANILGLPTLMTSMNEALRGVLLPELEQVSPDAYARRVQRSGVVNAWADVNFRQAVEATGRKNLIIAGVTTDIAVVFPSIAAVAAGYRVQVVLDACGSPFKLSEATARQRMAGAGVVLTSVGTLFAELAPDWNTPEGGRLAMLLLQQILHPV